MNIGKIVNDVEIIRLDELQSDNAPVEETPADDQPQPVSGR